MNPNLHFSRKTWYFLLLAAAAVSMLNGFAVLAGQDLSFLEMIAFGATGLAVLFLAAERENSKKTKQAYFGVFVVLMFSYLFGAPLGYLFNALVWPLLLALELRRGMPVQNPLRLTVFAEVLHLALLMMTAAGMSAAFLTNLFWVLTTIARGSGAMALYRAGTDEKTEG